jgi:probable rRNA maturation factor
MTAIDIQVATTTTALPSSAQFQVWVDAALQGQALDSELLIRLVDGDESAALNQQYRHKTGPTNILSFPFEAPPGIELAMLGDLVMCVPVIVQEALQQAKPVEHHWAHITVHGVLHLLGYDHIDDAEAEQMEALEIEILQQFNIPNPYLEESLS